MRNDACKLCPLSTTLPKKPRYVCLMADPQPCDVLVVADGPLPVDDVNGRIWEARVFRDIRKFLADKGVEAHYTYAIKCIKNDKTLKIKDEWTKTCSDTYLAKEIAAVNPRHIITLGANAFYAVTRAKGVTEKRGNRWTFPKVLRPDGTPIYVYPSIHPAQAAYNEDQRKVLMADLELFTNWITDENSVSGFDPKLYWVDTLSRLEKVRQRIYDAGGIVAVDIETGPRLTVDKVSVALNPYSPHGYIRSIQFCWDIEFGGVFVPLQLGEGCYWETENELGGKEKIPQIDCPFGEDLPAALKIIQAILNENQCIWHNGKFDRLWLYEWPKRVPGYERPILAPVTRMDTIHAAHLLDENRRLKLKQLITAELGIPTYDIPNKLSKNLSVLYPYGVRDTVATMLLAEKYTEDLRQPDNARLKFLYKKLVRPVDTLLTKVELRGWPVDEAVAVQVEEELGDKAVMTERAMVARLKDEGVSNPEEINFASTQQIGELIFEKLGLPMHEDKTIALTETGAKGTGNEAIFHLKWHPFVEKLLEWRGYNKALNTYVRPMLSAARGRGRLTTSYKAHGTVTGRTASGKEQPGAAGLNLQNIPQDKPGQEWGIRRIIRCRPGWVIIEADFSQIELRIAGHLSQDPLLLWAYRNGQDIHSIRAAKMLGLENENWKYLPLDEKYPAIMGAYKHLLEIDPKKAKTARGDAKPVNFGFLYGMYPKSFLQYALLNYGVTFSFAQARAIRDEYFADHSGLPKWYRKQEYFAREHGYVENLIGRRRRLPNMGLNPDSSRDAKTKYMDAQRMAINSPVQSFGSDLKLMACLEIDANLDPARGFLIGEVHDSILAEVKEDYVQEAATIMVQIMRWPALLNDFGVSLSVPIDAEAKFGISLGEAEEIKGL
jgi:uracil-DNA glycosylase family 4